MQNDEDFFEDEFYYNDEGVKHGKVANNGGDLLGAIQSEQQPVINDDEAMESEVKDYLQ